MKGVRVLVTGGAGFIGSCFIRKGLQENSSLQRIVNLDLLTYAGRREHLEEFAADPRYSFVQGDICDGELLLSLCREEKIDTIVHFAAESHVDRSIADPFLFYKTNVGGTLTLLETVRKLPGVRFHHVSTDEVYGSLGESGSFQEESPYRPNSPYAASKAASDHFVRAYSKTYGIEATLSHCSNNYGPCQHPEKLIPKMIYGCLNREPLPVYGKGDQVRDWLFVEDHAEALWLVLEKGRAGEVYDMGGEGGCSNLALVGIIIEKVAKQIGEDPQKLSSLIRFVEDRPGHDFRYAIDSSKTKKQLGWQPRHSFEQGLQKTIAWYLSCKENYVSQ